jgi:hypothetical protein
MTYTDELEQIEQTLDGNGLDQTPAEAIQTGDVRYEQDREGIGIQLAVDDDFATADLEDVLDDAYEGNTRNHAGSKRYSIRKAGLTDPSGFYIDDIIGGFTTRVEDHEDRTYVRMDFSDYDPDEAIEEAYRVAAVLDSK